MCRVKHHAMRTFEGRRYNSRILIPVGDVSSHIHAPATVFSDIERSMSLS